MRSTPNLAPRLALLTVLLVSACELARNRVTGPEGVASVFVAPDSVTLDPQQSFQFKVYGRSGAGDTLSVNAAWSATHGSITSTGLYTADTSDSDGTVTASIPLSGVTLTSSSQVRRRRVVQIVLTPSNTIVATNATQQFTALGVRNTGDTVPVNAAYTATGGTITSSGMFTAGAAAGTYSIIASYARRSLADTAVVTVTTVPVASVTVTPAAVSLSPGATALLDAVTRDAAGNVLAGRSISWSSSASGVATVSPAGLVTGVAAGSATITATSEGQSGTAVVAVTVLTPEPVASVTVSPSSASILVGATTQLNATLKDANGNTLTGRAISWATGSPAVATVSATKPVVGMGAGSATVAVAVGGTHSGFHASPSGTSGGDGSAARPWDLATALRGGNGRVQPGDTIWLRAGTYRGAFTSSLNGTAAAPIVVRQYPGEHATIDVNGWTSDALTVTGSYGVYWGFEIMSSSPDRTTVTPQRPHGVVNDGSHNRYVNLIVHDTGIGFYNYSSAGDVEIYGCLVYNNGWQATKGSGHALYIKSDAGPIYLRDNILFTQFAYGVHVYTNAGSGRLNNVHVEGNVSFNNGTVSTLGPAAVGANILMGGEEPVQNGTMTGNMTYFSPGYGVYNVDLGFQTTLNADLLVQGNYIAGGRRLVEVLYWQSLTVSGNTLVAPERPVVLNDPSTNGQNWSGDMHYRDPNATAWQFGGRDYTFSAWRTATGLATTDQAVSGLPPTRVFVRPNLYERGRATVVVYNWGRQAAVAADLANVLQVGDRYEVRNAQDFFGSPVTSGTYGGGTISLPMGGVTPPTPIGGSPTAPPKTGPDFDVFVVTKVAP